MGEDSKSGLSHNCHHHQTLIDHQVAEINGMQVTLDKVERKQLKEMLNLQNCAKATGEAVSYLQIKSQSKQDQ